MTGGWEWVGGGKPPLSHIKHKEKCFPCPLFLKMDERFDKPEGYQWAVAQVASELCHLIRQACGTLMLPRMNYKAGGRRQTLEWFSFAPQARLPAPLPRWGKQGWLPGLAGLQGTGDSRRTPVGEGAGTPQSPLGNAAPLNPRIPLPRYSAAGAALPERETAATQSCWGSTPSPEKVEMPRRARRRGASLSVCPPSPPPRRRCGGGCSVIPAPRGAICSLIALLLIDRARSGGEEGVGRSHRPGAISGRAGGQCRTAPVPSRPVPSRSFPGSPRPRPGALCRLPHFPP